MMLRKQLTISQLIDSLQSIQRQHGDILVHYAYDGQTPPLYSDNVGVVTDQDDGEISLLIGDFDT